MLQYEGGEREDRIVESSPSGERVQLQVLSPTGLRLVGREYAHILVQGLLLKGKITELEENEFTVI